MYYSHINNLRDYSGYLQGRRRGLVPEIQAYFMHSSTSASRPVQAISSDTVKQTPFQYLAIAVFRFIGTIFNLGKKPFKCLTEN